MAKLSIKRHATSEVARTQYAAKVDEHAEMVRCRYITKGDGQAMSYEAKHRQALAGGGAMITAEARALGITEQEVIDSVLAARERWELAGAKIEAARIKAKRDIRQADTPQAMHQVVQRFKENLPA